MQQEIYRLHSNDRLCYRDFYKELLTEERQLDVVRTVSGGVREICCLFHTLASQRIFLYFHTLFTDDFFASTSPFPCTQVQKHADHCARHCVKMEKQLEGEWLVAARGVLVIESPCRPCHLTHCCRHPIALRSTLQPRRHLTVAVISCFSCAVVPHPHICR